MAILTTAAMAWRRALLIMLVFSYVPFASSNLARAASDDPVVLTIAGDIAKTNRGATDGFADAFFRYHDITFARAFAFTRGDLERLGTHQLTATYPGKDLSVTVEGPRLSDVLDAVGARGETVHVLAFDGYSAVTTIAELRRYPVVLALKRNGRCLDIGGRGPAWVIYPSNEHPELAARDDTKWVWSVFFIRVE